jgi:NDP-sugar pyrophosphorylase family protein
VKAVLLAAGRGTRLAPLTDEVPKILTPVNGEPLLERQLRYLAANGVTEAAINAHHLADVVEAYVRNRDHGLTVTTFRENELRGTAGALFPMRDLLTERFIVLYGDVVTDVDLLDFGRRARGIATLAYHVSSDVREKGLLDVDAAGLVRSFIERPTDRDSGCVNAGIYCLDPALFEYIPPAGDFGYDVWPAVLEAGEAIYGEEIRGYLLDMGSPGALAQLEEDVRKGVLAW